MLARWAGHHHPYVEYINSLIPVSVGTCTSKCTHFILGFQRGEISIINSN